MTIWINFILLSSPTLISPPSQPLKFPPHGLGNVRSVEMERVIASPDLNQKNYVWVGKYTIRQHNLGLPKRYPYERHGAIHLIENQQPKVTYLLVISLKFERDRVLRKCWQRQKNIQNYEGESFHFPAFFHCSIAFALGALVAGADVGKPGHFLFIHIFAYLRFEKLRIGFFFRMQCNDWILNPIWTNLNRGKLTLHLFVRSSKYQFL